MKLKYLLIFFLFSSALYKSQVSENNKSRKDSLRAKFESDSAAIYKPKDLSLFAALDFRNAYIGERFLSFVGPQAGVIVKNKHIVGVAFYFLNKFSPFQSDKLTTYTFEEINYFTAFYQYILYDSKRFDLMIPVEIGYGNYRAYKETQNQFIESNVAPSAIGLRCVLLPHKWIGLKLGAGYRYVWEKSQHIGLDGLYFSVGVKIDFRYMYMDYKYFHLKQKYKHELKDL